jgi:hypothetical protein
VGTAAAPLVIDTNGTSVSWVSGPTFTAANNVVAGMFLVIAGAEYWITAVNSSTTLTINITAGVQNGVAATIGPGDLISINSSAHCEVTGNNISSKNATGCTVTLGIALSNVTGGATAQKVLIANNVVQHCGQSGISVQSAANGTQVNDFQIVNNLIVNCGQGGTLTGANAGINVIGAEISNGYIAGNFVRDDQGSPTMAHWLYANVADATLVRLGINYAVGTTNQGVGGPTGVAGVVADGGSQTAAGEMGGFRVLGSTELMRLAMGVDNSGTMKSWIQSTQTGTAVRQLDLNPLGGAITVGANLTPLTADGAALGTTALPFSDLRGASGFVFDLDNGNWQATHSSGIVTVGTGDWRITNAGTNAASAVTVGGAQTLTNKTLTTPVIATISGASAVNAGSVVAAGELGGFRVLGSTSAMRLIMGVDNTGTMVSYIQSVENGVATRALQLNPLGGGVTTGGDLAVTGALSKGSGTFLIDHPLDPEHRQLKHGFVESPRYDLIDRGVTSLVGGVAHVNIDEASRMTSGTFAALTQNAEVSALVNKTGFARVRASEVVDGLFTITCEDRASTDTIHWMVMAERADTFIKTNESCWTDESGRLVPEREKEVAT